MSIILNFVIGAGIGWILEFTYRSTSQKRLTYPSLINVQMYGLTACFMFLLAVSDARLVYKLPMIILIPTVIEFITGYIYMKWRGIRLWDYSDKPFNIRGIVCLEFSLYWFTISFLYYLVIEVF